MASDLNRTTRPPRPKRTAAVEPGGEAQLDDARLAAGELDATGERGQGRPHPAQEPVTTMQDQVTTTLDPAGTEPATERPALRPGMMFEHYQLIRELGRGGMGAVYLARDTRLGRRVAIKFLARHGGELTARFLAEARMIARCEHDNIVAIHHAGEAHGHSYMVLEYVVGVTLRKWIKQRWQEYELPNAPDHGSPRQQAPVSATLTVELMVPVVRALAHAHAMGLVHRDLKPENVMLADDGMIKVLDFGVAKVLRPLASTHHKGLATRELQTGEGVILGSLPYMAPEQFGIDAIDERSDLWAVGILLWELCTGHHPLGELSPGRLMSIEDIDEPMPLLAVERPDLGALAEIVDRCLRKRKAERMASARDLLSVLEPLLSGHRAAQAAPATAAEPDNPYVGLAAFQETDAGRFFGRDRDIASMLGQLRNQRLVTVAGASGAGKSSFVRAGVIPALARSGQRWEWFIVRPGREPLAGLADVLAQVAGPVPMPRSTAASIEALRAEPGALGTALRDRCRRRQARLLLFVDQFEELYTLGADRGARDAFVRCLEGVADDASSPLRVVLSVRADFLDRVAEDRGFMTEIARGLTFLPPMQQDELRQAVIRPLQAAGFELEHQERLIATMLEALAATRAPLPLLQFTAARLWELRDLERKQITQASYDALGGVAGALSAHADTVLAGFSVREQDLARKVLTSLVTDERTRVIVSLDELRGSPTGETLDGPDEAAGAIDNVVQRLVEARLLLMERDVHQGIAMVELSHESLIDRWPRLGQWLAEDQDESAFRARLGAAAGEWNKQGRSEDLLWRGRAAEDARRRLERWRMREQKGPGATTRTQADLGTRDLAFLRAVVDLAVRTRRRRRRVVSVIMACLAGIAVVVSVLAVRAARLADDLTDSAARERAKAALAESQSVQARNASRMASARESQSDSTLVLALVRELEPAQELPRRWDGLARAALYQGVAQVVLAHQASVWSAAFSPDGTRIVTASGDKTARVWAADGTGAPLILQGHQGTVTWAAFSPDGAHVVTASEDGTARVWNADGTGAPVVLQGHKSGVNWAAFSPDGARIVTASGDKTARVWNADGTGAPLVLQGHKGAVISATFSPDGTRIVTASFDKTARGWNADGTGAPVALQGHQDIVTSAVFSPDGTRIVTSSGDKTARVWNADGSGTPLVLQGHQDIVRSAAFSPDGTRIVTSSFDRTARVWNADGTGTPRVLQGHQGTVTSAAFSPDGTRVVTASWDKTARVWDAGSTGTPWVLRGDQGVVLSAAFSPDGTRIVIASRDKIARVWNTDGSGTPRVLQGHRGFVLSAAFSPDGTRIATASWDMTARVWNADGTGTPRVLQGHQDLVASAVFSPDGTRIVTASRDKTARVWNADGAGTPLVLQGHQGIVISAAFSLDGTRIVTASWDKTARVWNADGTGTPRVLQGHQSGVNSAVFSPDGTRIVTSSGDKTARVWNADDSGTPLVLQGHQDSVISAAFSPDGTRIATISKDHTIRLWNADGTGEPMIVQAPDLDGYSVAFSPDGTRIVSTSHSERIAATGEIRYGAKIWPLDLRQFTGPDDTRLWLATSYCPPIELRRELLGVSQDSAAHDLERCQRRVAEARAHQPSSQR